MKMIINHTPVLLKETISSLNINPDGIYIDMTLGLGGHSIEIAKKLKKGKLISIDQDQKAIEKAKENLIQYKDKIIFINDNFSNIKSILSDLNINYIDGALYDLGTSYYQLTSPERGFSYKHLKLDMRMNLKTKQNALIILNTYKQEELEIIFKEYGEVKFYKDLAREIIFYREKVKKIETTEDLNSIIDKFSKKDRKSNINNIYQAIRVEVNDEFNALKKSLKSLVDFLKANSTISIITFHSLEDKIVKDFFNKLKQQKIETIFETKYFYKTRKTIYASKNEVEQNRASRSAKLRTLVKIYD